MFYSRPTYPLSADLLRLLMEGAIVSGGSPHIPQGRSDIVGSRPFLLPGPFSVWGQNKKEVAMATIYIPAHTHCSTDGGHSGSCPLGVAFFSREEAEAYLRDHPNDRGWWGDGEDILTLSLEGHPHPPKPIGWVEPEPRLCPACGAAPFHGAVDERCPICDYC